MMEYEARTGKQKKNKDAPPGAHQAGFKGHTRVYFPSRETVRTSRGGTNVSCRNAPANTTTLSPYPQSAIRMVFPDYNLVSRYDLLPATVVGFQIIPSRSSPGFQECADGSAFPQQAALCAEARLWGRGSSQWVGVPGEPQPVRKRMVSSPNLLKIMPERLS